MSEMSDLDCSSKNNLNDIIQMGEGHYRSFNSHPIELMSPQPTVLKTEKSKIIKER